MDFSIVEADDCMHDVAVNVSAEVTDQLRELYRGMYARNEEFQGVMPNVVLAGMTLAWLGAVHAVFGTADYESALRLIKTIRPSDDDVTKEMKMAARDFLRRSRWLPKRRKA